MPTTRLVALATPLLLAAHFGAVAAKSKTSTTASSATSTTASASSEAETNGYDAVMCGEDGYADGSGYSCEHSHTHTHTRARARG